MIPESEDGGGTAMIWDRGTWELEVPDVGGALARGDLKFTVARPLSVVSRRTIAGLARAARASARQLAEAEEVDSGNAR